MFSNDLSYHDRPPAPNRARTAEPGTGSFRPGSWSRIGSCVQGLHLPAQGLDLGLLLGQQMIHLGQRLAQSTVDLDLLLGKLADVKDRQGVQRGPEACQ